eukprot:347373-Chlamydomonas_euryale.AAC.3
MTLLYTSECDNFRCIASATICSSCKVHTPVTPWDRQRMRAYVRATRIGVGKSEGLLGCAARL